MKSNKQTNCLTQHHHLYEIVCSFYQFQNTFISSVSKSCNMYLDLLLLQLYVTESVSHESQGFKPKGIPPFFQQLKKSQGPYNEHTQHQTISFLILNLLKLTIILSYKGKNIKVKVYSMRETCR